jgi:Ca-activated chloride channel family protein
MKSQRGEIKESMRKKIIKLSKNHGLISPETTFIFLELREEPVLGIGLRNIIPIKVEENTLADEIDIEELDENDQIGFLFKARNIRINERNRKNLNDNIYLDRCYPKEKLLRIIAKNQLADGAFVDYEDSSTEDKIETTSMVLLAFNIGDNNIDIYLNQLNKSIEFIYNAIVNLETNLDDRVSKMAILYLNLSIEKKIFKDKNVEKAQQTINYLYKVLNEEESSKQMLDKLIENSFKKNLISLFKLSEDGGSITEKIVLNTENNSIFSMAKLAVMKCLKEL